MIYATAVDNGDNTVMVKVQGKYLTILSSSYYGWHLASRSTLRVVATSNFPLSKDIAFETLLPANFQISNMWRTDLLAHWWWVKNKTGILTSQERLDALEAAVKELLPRTPS